MPDDNAGAAFHDSQVTKPHTVYPALCLDYRAPDGREVTLEVHLHIGGIVQMIRTLKWAYHNGVVVTARYIPPHSGQEQGYSA